jgi:hypothetical protein
VTDPLLHLRLAGITRLSLFGRGPRDAFLFDPHRLALPAWAFALGERRDALLITLDRHFDLARPPTPPPDASAGLRAIDEYARWSLGVRNDDHVLAAMEAGLVGDAIVIARSHVKGSFESGTYVDARGRSHRLVHAPSVDGVAEAFGTASAPPVPREAQALLAAAPDVLLDFDIDCFTTLSDVDPTAVVPWPRALIHEFIFPPDVKPFWDAVLERCRALTIAREPYHCGGVLAGDRLFADAAEVIFRELLGADLP